METVLCSPDSIATDATAAMRLQFGTINDALSFGCEHFSLDFGIVSQIEDSIYTLRHVISPENILKPGEAFDFDTTYCIHCIKRGGVTSYNRVSESEIATHPCYEVFSLESYIGAPLFVGGKLFGTLNFSSADSRRPFSQADHRLMGELAATVERQV